MLIGVLCLVLMPLDYRAGASISHPHSILQLLYDLNHGSLMHHDAGVTAEAHPNEAHQHPQPVRSDYLSVELPNAGESRRASAASPSKLIAALTKPATNSESVSDAGDEPEPSPRSAPGKYVAYSLALPVAALLAWHWSRRRQPWLLAPAWRGLTLTPESPPPQFAPTV